MWINPVDAAKVGVASGDWVKVKSPTSKPSEVHTNHAGEGWYKFKVKVTSRVRPGVVAVCHSYGRWAGSSRPWHVDGKAQYYDERIGAGWQMNPLVLADPVLKDIVVMDPIGGGTMFFGTPVKIEKV
jgi:anaerobic selenocysteine-containing dehydrogenase